MYYYLCRELSQLWRALHKHQAIKSSQQPCKIDCSLLLIFIYTRNEKIKSQSWSHMPREDVNQTHLLSLSAVCADRKQTRRLFHMTSVQRWAPQMPVLFLSSTWDTSRSFNWPSRNLEFRAWAPPELSVLTLLCHDLSREDENQCLLWDRHISNTAVYTQISLGR